MPRVQVEYSYNVDPKRFPRWLFPVAFAVASCVFLVWGVRLHLSNQGFTAQALQVPGLVVAMEEQKPRTGRLCAQVEYTPRDGASRRFIDGFCGNPPLHRPGDRVVVAYLPAGEARIVGTPSATHIPYILSFAFFLGSLVTWRFDSRFKRATATRRQASGK